jgi:hypothetical protein
MCERVFSAYTSFLFHCSPEPWFYNALLSSIPHVNAQHKDLPYMAVYGRISENCLSNNGWLTASKARTNSHVRQIQSAEEANLGMPGRGAGARYLEGEQIAQIAWSRRVEEHWKKPPTPGRPGPGPYACGDAEGVGRAVPARVAKMSSMSRIPWGVMLIVY